MSALVRRREQNAISRLLTPSFELKPKPIELLQQPGGVAPGYAVARENPVNRTEGSNCRRGDPFVSAIWQMHFKSF
jgi:hypothetical protein